MQAKVIINNMLKTAMIQSIKDKLQIVKNWGNKYDVPIIMR